MARHGENIRKRKDGRWEGRYKAFDERKGRDIYRSVYGRDYGEAKEKLSRAKFGLVCRGPEDGNVQEGGRGGIGKEDGSVCCIDGSGGMAGNSGGGKDGGAAGNSGGGKDGGVLFSQAAEEWLAQIRGKRKYSTYIKYSIVYRTHLAGAVGSCRLCADTAQELREKIFDHISGEGMPEKTSAMGEEAGKKISDHISGEGMSESLQKSIVCVANQILAYANEHYSSHVPLLEQIPVKAKKKEAGTFSNAEQVKLLNYIYGEMDKFKVAVLLCLHVGLRLGELCALQWTDIDFVGMTLTVNRTVQRIAMPGYLTKTILLETEPKSGSSRRTIPLPPELVEILSRLKGEQPYVFGGKKPLDPRTMQYRFRKILKEAGVDSRNFHTLRHTFATNCVENGMDVKALSEILGHSDVKITLNRYVHPTMDSKRRQMGALSDFYGQICGQAA